MVGDNMTDNTLTPILTTFGAADGLLEEARAAHEKYLIKQQDADLERAIECYKVKWLHPNIKQKAYI